LPASTVVQPMAPATRPRRFLTCRPFDMIPIVEPAVHSVSLNRWMFDAFRACMAPASGGTRALFHRRHTLRVRLGRCRRDLCGCYGRAGTADPRGASRVVDRAACRDAMVVVPEELKRLSPGRFGCTIQKWKSEMLSPRRARKHVSRPAVLVKHRAHCPYRPPMISQ
jgi:hypothetical protein